MEVEMSTGSVAQAVLCSTVTQRSISVLLQVWFQAGPGLDHLYRWGKTMGLARCADLGKKQGTIYT